MEITFEVIGLPPSYNKHLQFIWHMKEVCLTPEAHHFKNRVKMSIPPCEFKSTNKILIEIEYYSNFQYASGKNKKIDLQNLDKLLIDAIFDRIGIDDSTIWEMKAKKVQSEIEKTIVKLSVL